MVASRLLEVETITGEEFNQIVEKYKEQRI